MAVALGVLVSVEFATAVVALRAVSARAIQNIPAFAHAQFLSFFNFYLGNI